MCRMQEITFFVPRGGDTRGIKFLNGNRGQMLYIFFESAFYPHLIVKEFLKLTD
jgi:hypothetical protein